MASFLPGKYFTSNIHSDGPSDAGGREKMLEMIAYSVPLFYSEGGTLGPLDTLCNTYCNTFDEPSCPSGGCTGSTHCECSWIGVKCDDTYEEACGSSSCDGSCPGCVYDYKGCEPAGCYDYQDQDPDSDYDYCDGCSLDWVSQFSSNKCCGDDSGEDNSAASGATCYYCVNAVYGTGDCDADGSSSSCSDEGYASGATCYHDESCDDTGFTTATQDTTIYGGTGWGICDSKSQTGSDDWCLDQSADTCYYQSGDSCGTYGWGDSGGADFDRDTTCYGTGDESGDTCYTSSETCSSTGCTNGATDTTVTSGGQTDTCGSSDCTNGYHLNSGSDRCHYSVGCSGSGWTGSLDSTCYGDADGEPDIVGGYCYYGTESCDSGGCTNGANEAGPASNWANCDVSSQTDTNMYCGNYDGDVCYYQTTDACDTTNGWDYNTDSTCYGNADGEPDIAGGRCYYGAESCDQSGCTNGAYEDGPLSNWAGCDAYSAQDNDMYCVTYDNDLCRYKTTDACNPSMGWNYYTVNCYGDADGTADINNGKCYYGTESCSKWGCTHGTSDSGPGAITWADCDINGSGSPYSAVDNNAYCFDDSEDTCYYDDSDNNCHNSLGWNLASVTCRDPGDVNGSNPYYCHYDNGGSVDESDSCTYNGCVGIDAEISPTCDEGGIADSNASCGEWNYSGNLDRCFYDPGDPCDSDTDGWDYSVDYDFDGMNVTEAENDYEFNESSGKCYYSINCTTNGWDALIDICYDPGTVNNGSTETARCYWGGGCSAGGANASCSEGELVTSVIACDSYANWTDGAGFCYHSPTDYCYFNDTDLCGDDDDGWDYTGVDCDGYDDTEGSDGNLTESEVNSTSCSLSCSGSSCCNVQSATCSVTYQCQGFHDLVTIGNETDNETCHYSNSGSWIFNTTAESNESACGDGYDNDCDGMIDTADPDCQCSSGDDCTGGEICIEQLCYSECNDTFDGQMCSDSSNSYDNDGICTRVNGGWTCDKTESSYDGNDYWSDCSNTTYGEECDNASLAGGYSENGVCGGSGNAFCYTDYASNSNGSINGSAVFGSESEVCDDPSENGYQCDDVSDASFSPGSQRCDSDDDDCDACDNGNIGDDGDCEEVCGADPLCDELAPGFSNETLYCSPSCIYNLIPSTPSPLINSTDGTNKTGQDLNCYGTLKDDDGENMNVTVRWYINGSQQLEIDYNHSYPNSTFFVAVLGSGNTSRYQNWSCSIRADDGISSSGWGDSTNITIENTIPSVPVQNTPENESFVTELHVILSCSSSSDPDGDSLTYYYFGDSSDGSTLLGSNDTGTAYNWTGLSNDTTYYWKCLASDGTANSSETSVWNFTTDISNAPAIENATIDPSPDVYTNESLRGYCNASDTDDEAEIRKFEYRWYNDSVVWVNGTAFKDGSISTSNIHTCGIRANDSRVLCWGEGEYGKLGDGNTNPHNVGEPSLTTDASAYLSVDTGNDYTCGIRANDSRVLCWGKSSLGSLGDGDQNPHNVGNPNVTTDASAYLSVSAGVQHTCGIRASDGRVLCWGYGADGKLGHGETQTKANPTLTTDSSAYLSVYTGSYHTCGIRASDGRVLCWGRGEYGRLGDGNTSYHNVFEPNLTTDSSAYLDLSCGNERTCGIRASDGRVLCWGRGEHGSLGDGDTSVHYVGNPNVTTDPSAYRSISASGVVTCGIRASDGRVLCWGNGVFGRLGDGDTSVHYVGNPNVTTDSSAYASISVGSCTCGIRANDSRVLCWGNGIYGRMGDGDTSDHSVGDPNVTTDSSEYSSFWSDGRKEFVDLVDYSKTSSGEGWIFSCRAYDGIYWSSWMNSSVTSIINYIPEVNSNYTYPSNIYTDTDIYLNVTCHDIDPGDTLTVYTQPYLNGGKDEGEGLKTVPNGTDSLVYTYGSGNFSKGDTVVLEFWCGDGDDNTSKYNSTQLSVLNSVPAVPVQNSPGDGTSVEANHTLLDCNGSSDADDDSLTYYYFGDSVDGSTLLGSNDTGTAYNWTGLSDDTTYFWKCLASDGEGNSSETGVWNFTTDINDAPVIHTSRIDPSPGAYTNETLEGYCNASDLDGENITYYYVFYKDGEKSVYGQSSGPGYLSGVEYNIANASHTNTLKGEEWKLSCMGSDGVLNSSWLNGSVTSIVNSAPSVTGNSTYPSSVYTDTDVYLNVTCHDDNQADSLTVYAQPYLNGIKDESCLMTNVTNSSDSLVYTYGSGNYSRDDSIHFEFWCGDGTANTTRHNSTSITILNSAPDSPPLRSPVHNFRSDKNHVLLNCSGSGDIDNDSLFYYYFGDTVIGTTLLGSNNTEYGYNWTELPDDGLFFWRCMASDGTDNNSVSTIFDLTTDVPDPPDIPVPTINSTDGSDTTDQDLHCSSSLTDADWDDMNVTVRWFLDGNLTHSFDYNYSYYNGQSFHSVLGSGNTTYNQIWSCSIRSYDGSLFSGWGNSSNLTIIDDRSDSPPGGPGGGISPGTSAPTGGTVAECNEDWMCTEWGNCTDGTERRECIDLNDCGTEETKPETARSCGIGKTLQLDLLLPDSINASKGFRFVVNISTDGKQDILIDYIIMDREGNVIFEQNEKRSIDDSSMFTKSLDIDLDPEEYHLLVKARYGEQHALREVIFNVNDNQLIISPLEPRYNINLVWITAFGIIVVFGGVFAYKKFVLRPKYESFFSKMVKRVDSATRKQDNIVRKMESGISKVSRTVSEDTERGGTGKKDLIRMIREVREKKDED